MGLGRALAGAIAGAGRGMTELSIRKREDMLAALAREQELADAERDRNWQVTDRDLGFEHDIGMQEDRQGHDIGMQEDQQEFSDSDREDTQKWQDETFGRDRWGRETAPAPGGGPDIWWRFNENTDKAEPMLDEDGNFIPASEKIEDIEEQWRSVDTDGDGYVDEKRLFRRGSDGNWEETDETQALDRAPPSADDDDEPTKISERVEEFEGEIVADISGLVSSGIIFDDKEDIDRARDVIAGELSKRLRANPDLNETEVLSEIISEIPSNLDESGEWTFSFGGPVAEGEAAEAGEPAAGEDEGGGFLGDLFGGGEEEKPDLPIETMIEAGKKMVADGRTPEDVARYLQGLGYDVSAEELQ